ncbi:hypothetical protein J8L98_19925 [Pseudoalteromonas sp. MMG013]|uniref:Orphan protein n=1 Tax=Pseudoalteromonas aurantia 208 TaxID=1314867 RepID=A0ABR9E8Y3_9GAMM|nr:MULTISPECIES: hypothetical protein [Pseudoalteromonas]MBE0366710.1 hypothetical protein [Pseudoalteromonas aurantia 208]MBQ4848054.1 hypothetical protein [Pseudoalteromonas sp. MMG005]MBQ4863960.1 hypothetical protein [Pseudoalteromonas sp. MMG013]
MKYAPLLLLSLFTCTASALPIIVSGETTSLTKSDFTHEKKLFVSEGGVDRYAEVAYQVKLPLVHTAGISQLDVHLSGSITSAWYSSNFGMTASLYCNDTKIGEDTTFGVRYERVSYRVKPSIVKSSVHIPAGCQEVTVRLDKVGSIARQYYTNIRDIDINVYLLAPF